MGLALLCAAFGWGAQARAEGAPPAWEGVWRGTIGKAAVEVCLQHENYGDIGAYYYLRHLGIITLGRLAPAGASWTEAPNSDRAAKGPLWHFAPAAPGHLQGLWSDGTKSEPFELARVPMAKPGPDDPGTACGNLAFSLPRFTKPLVTLKPAVLKGVSYTRVLVDPGKQFADSATETFQLQGASPAIRRVNAELYKTVPTSPANATYFACSMAALGQNGLDGDAASTITPLIITTGWLVLQDSEQSDCGGAHPNADVAYATWDLRKGAKVNLYDWFSWLALTQTVNGAGTRDQYVTVAFTAPFRKLIDAAYPRGDADCREAEREADFWTVRLTAQGMAFTPELAHVEMACTDDAEIPFARLVPFLTPAGRAEVSGFLAEVSLRR